MNSCQSSLIFRKKEKSSSTAPDRLRQPLPVWQERIYKRDTMPRPLWAASTHGRRQDTPSILLNNTGEKMKSGLRVRGLSQKKSRDTPYECPGLWIVVPRFKPTGFRNEGHPLLSGERWEDRKKTGKCPS